MIKKITNNERIMAIIISGDHSKSGIEFFTPNDFPQQLAYMKHIKDYIIPPHIHNIIHRQVLNTNEVLFIKSGKIRVDFYDDEKIYLKSIFLIAGDVILLAYGGHGFVMLEESEIIEVKQGPFVGERDKTRFEPISEDQVRVIE